MADTITDAFEQAFTELGFDDTPDDGPVENPAPDTEEPEGEAPEEPEVGEEEDTEGEPDEEETGEPEGEDAEEGDDESEDEESDDESPVIEIAEGSKLRLPDGTEVDADKAVLFQQAFTKKTQELARERQEFEQERDAFAEVQRQVEDTYEQMRSWYEERVENPTEWVQEIALESGDATRTIAKAIYELGTAGRLDPKFVEAFGIEAGVVADMASEADTASELAELRAWREKQEAERAQAQTVQQKAAEYQRQWDEIKLTHGLELNGEEETAAKRELMEFAVSKRLTHDLGDAYLLMQASRQSQEPVPAPKPDPVTTEKKRALAAVNPRSKGGGAAKSAQKQAPKNSRSAALEAIAEFGL